MKMRMLSLFCAVCITALGCVACGGQSTTSSEDSSDVVLQTTSTSKTTENSNSPAVNSTTAGTSSSVSSTVKTTGSSGTKTSSNKTTSTTATSVSTTTSTSATKDPYAPISTGEWKQDQFYLSSGYTDYNEKLVRLSKEAGYNLMIFESDKNDSRIESTLDVCDEIGMKALLSYVVGGGGAAPAFNEAMIRNTIKKYSHHKSLYGYNYWDEMTPEAFSTSGKLLQSYFKKYDPAKLAYSCLLPSYGPLAWDTQQQEASEYLKYVEDYLKIVDPDTISFDYYPHAVGNSITTHDWYRDMGLYRVMALEYNKPFWYWYQSVDMNNAPNYSATNITEAQIRVGMYTGLAYGAKGLIAWLGRGYAFDREGNKLARFNECKNLNAEVMTVGQYLFDKTTTKIYHTGLPGGNYNEIYYLDDLTASDLIASASNGLIISIFEDGKTDTQYMLVVNKNYSFMHGGTIKLKGAHKIQQLNAKNGKLTVVADSSDSLSLSLAKGNGVLYVIN